MKAQQLSHLPKRTWCACKWWSRAWSSGLRILVQAVLSQGWEESAKLLLLLRGILTTSLPAAISSLDDFFSCSFLRDPFYTNPPGLLSQVSAYRSLSLPESALCCSASTLIASKPLSGRKVGGRERAPDGRVRDWGSNIDRPPKIGPGILGKSRTASQPWSALPIIARRSINQREPSFLMS